MKVRIVCYQYFEHLVVNVIFFFVTVVWETVLMLLK